MHCIVMPSVLLFVLSCIELNRVESFKISIGGIIEKNIGSDARWSHKAKQPSFLRQNLRLQNPLLAQQRDDTGYFEGFEKSLRNNLYLIAPLVSFASVMVGVAYYGIRHDWNAHTSFYYTTQAIFGLMEDVPIQTEYPDKFFTLGLKVWGELLIAGAIGALATSVVDGAISKSREKLKKLAAPVDIDGDGKLDFFEIANFYINNFLFSIDWEDNKAKYLITLAAFSVWVAGILYGIFYEGFDLSRAIYFSLSQISAAGTMAPVCEGDEFNCDMGVFRGVFNSLYLWIGYPLFSITVGQFAGLVIENQVLEKERAKMRKPLTDDEYNFVASINGPAGCDSKAKIDVAEFIVMQLLRLERLNTDEMADIKALFESLDQDGSGQIDRQEILMASSEKNSSPSDRGDGTGPLLTIPAAPVELKANITSKFAHEEVLL